MARRSAKVGAAACAVAALAVVGAARADGHENATAAANATEPAEDAGGSLPEIPGVDFSTLASNPQQIIAALPQMGFSQECVSSIMGAGAVCLLDFQALGKLGSDPEFTAAIQKVTGVDVTSAVASAESGNATEADIMSELGSLPTLSDDQIQELITAVLPMAQKELPSKDADGNGIISPACCTQMEPLVTNNCMCTKQAMGYLYQALEGRGITDLNTYTPLLSGVMDKLSCTALNNMVFYPSSQCPASRRMGLFR